MLLSRHQNVGQNRDIKIAKRSFENVSQFKYFVLEKIKRILNFGIASYHSIQNLFFCCQKCKN
jgi:hypothetical protein